jgi:hypothetical protein
MSGLPEKALPTNGAVAGHPRSTKLGKLITVLHRLNQHQKARKQLREACREAFARLLGHPLAAIRPIREVDHRMEALEDLKQGRRGPASNGLRHLAKVFRRDPRTIRRWVEAGYFPGAYKTNGGQWRIPPDCLFENQLPPKLKKRRLKVPNRRLKQQAVNQFNRLNYQFTSIFLVLHDQFLKENGCEPPINLEKRIEALKDENFVEFLKPFLNRIINGGSRGFAKAINALAILYAKTCIQRESNTEDAESSLIKPDKNNVKGSRRYRSAMTVTYLASFYKVHRSTIHRWLNNDKDFKLNVLNISATLGNEAVIQEIEDTYTIKTNHPTMDEGCDDADLDPNE